MTELCAITLSRDFSTINDKTYQLQHKTLPPNIDFLQLKIDNTDSSFIQTPYTKK